MIYFKCILNTLNKKVNSNKDRINVCVCVNYIDVFEGLSNFIKN